MKILDAEPARRSNAIDDYGYGFFTTAFGYSLIAMAFTLLVVAALSQASWLHRLRIPGAESLALWSYAIYLSHKPLAMIVARALEDFGLSSTTILAAVTAACLVGGLLLYRLVETPFMALRNRGFASNSAGAPSPNERAQA